MEIFHIATESDWARAQQSGAYTTSTRGRTLEDEGFLHAGRRDQVAGVFNRYYADADEPLVLLTIDTELLGVPVLEEEVPGGETFPHVYGAIPPSAVVDVVALGQSRPKRPDNR